MPNEAIRHITGGQTQPVTFIIKGPVPGIVVITDFRPGVDHLLLQGKGLPRSWFGIRRGSYERLEEDDTSDDIYSNLRNDGDGNAVIDLHERGKIVLNGVRIDSLSAADFMFKSE